MSNSPSQLKSELKSRHISMISIAGVIGAALFVGSGQTIALAGPAAILAYLAGGLLVVLVMRMLGELASLNPDTGSFSTYAEKAIGRYLGFTIGWLYWSFWSMLMGWEAYVAGILCHDLIGFFPNWTYSLIIALILMATNFASVKHYGEIEFWLALIKITAIIIFLILGALALCHLWPLSQEQGIPYLTSRGFMPNGFHSVVVALLGAIFAYMGAEIITIAAAESQNPEKEIIKNTNSVIFRICTFYLGSLFITICLVPWDNPLLEDPSYGTYAVTLMTLGIPYAKLIVNIIVLISIISCFNSALYTSSRMLFSLSVRGDAPLVLKKTSARTGSPYLAVFISSLFTFLSIILAATSQMNFYDILMQTTGCIALYVYLCICISHIVLRKKSDKLGIPHKIKMWCFPWLSYLTTICIILAIITMMFEGSYFNEILYTSILAIVILCIGIYVDKFNIGRTHE